MSNIVFCDFTLKMMKISLFRYSLIFAIYAPLVHSTSIESVSIEQILLGSQFVFEGQVQHARTELSAGNRNIWTVIDFRVDHVIKGPIDKSTITLRFLGGKFNGKVMTVGDMQYPEVGERGIYFVESLDRTQVHPLFGWAQGHILIIQDELGIDRVMTASKKPITGVSPGTSPTASEALLSNGDAQDLVVAEKGSKALGLPLADFKNQLSALLNKLVD